MALSLRTIGIIVSSVIAVALIALAVAFSGPLPFSTSTVNAESTHQLLVDYASRDTDNDGLPDWQEALYGTDPNNPHSVDPNHTDGEAVALGLVKPKFATATTTPIDNSTVPGVDASATTLTDQFARQFFAQYLQDHAGQSPTPDQVATYVEQAVTNLNQTQARPNTYNQGQVRVSGTGADALLSYSASIESAFAKNNPGTERSEVDYLSDAVLKNDTAALKQVGKIGASYTAIAKAIIATPAPTEVASTHLALANALARIGADITDMTAMNTDPLRGYLGLANYENDGPQLIKALSNMDAVYHAEGAAVPTGTAGSSFYSLMEQAAAGAPSTSP